ncbi:arsenate-mycothiol transferase ArsC [Nesterenkonia haasae]|uniref:arsenate-mycothiol transferase ArsC n=1 Tax=Nesterenkonia haasae TaxID=2587813 RepID=UPI001391B415|nr:low molecular weight phosphatase family protein [Nesterenkonia haasae]NDK32695.1 low molecular weight phosphatase family protein [Nesterenkonia haasae]
MSDQPPGVLFVCVKNGGKSQMAAGLLRKQLHQDGKPDSVTVSSAGTKAGQRINALSASVLSEVGIDIHDQQPTQLTEEGMREAGYVIIIGAEAEVPEVDGVVVERWETVEPSLFGVEGHERMVMIREDLAARTKELAARF